MKYLVMATQGPTFMTPGEAVELLEGMVLPSFAALIEHEKKGTLVGGLPVGDRAFAMIVEAASNDALDKMLRALPVWSLLDWEVTPLQSFSGRAKMERENVKQLKARG